MTAYRYNTSNANYELWFKTMHKDFRDEFVEMSRDVKYIREDISELKDQIRSYDTRLTNVEQTQKLITGKLSIIVIGIGAFIVASVQALTWLWDKIAK